MCSVLPEKNRPGACAIAGRQGLPPRCTRADGPNGTSTRQPCRLLHLVSTFQIKTDTKWLVQIARYLDPAAYRLTAACFYDDGPIRGQLDAMGADTFNLDVSDERDPRAILRARRLIKETGCRIVHTHLLRADLWGGLAARWARVPAIVSTVYAIGQFRRARRRRSDRLLDGAGTMLPTHVVAVSQAVKRDCVDRLRMDSEQITVIRTGIDPPQGVDPVRVAEWRSRWSAGSDGPLVVTLSRLSYEKGIDVLIDAASVLRETHPRARIVVVGDGPDHGALVDRVRAAGLTDSFFFAGFEADVWPALSAADVVCLPSKSEGMPNALLEAMAAGRPIVATAVGGIPEAIVSEENGLLVRPGDPRQLAAAIARLLDDSQLGQRLGRAAQRTVDERFTARETVARYGELYQRLLMQRRPAGVGVAAAS